MKLTVADVVKRLRRYRPEDEEELLKKCQLPLQFVADGAFRNVYEVIGLPLVIKVPISSYCACGNPSKRKRYKEHARSEHKMLQRVLRSTKKYVPLKPYMPKFHYFSTRTGVTAVKKYRLLIGDDDKRIELDRLVSRITGTNDPDVNNTGNVGLDEWNNLVLLDLGCLINDQT